MMKICIQIKNDTDPDLDDFGNSFLIQIITVFRIRIRPLEKKLVKHKLNTEYILGLGDKLLLSVFRFRIRILSFWAIRIR
jgi:hypothetical protein